MKKARIKQGTLAWEKARSTRIGGSEVFDIVRYYATDDELQNCGINAEKFKGEMPYTTAWALFHKLKNDGIYQKEALAPEFAEYGLSIESYGLYYLQKGRTKKLKPGEVYIDDKLVASLDISGISEEIDCVPFSYGSGNPKINQKFVCEQKTMMPQKIKDGIPFKYIVQAQYQLEMTKSDFFILQLMTLNEDTPFIRGKICQMSKKVKFDYLDKNMTVRLVYFKSNIHLSNLIKTCLTRFFEAVDTDNEPTPYIANDNQQSIIESIRLNSLYNPEAIIKYDLTDFVCAKKSKDECDAKKIEELQKIIELAKANNACKFQSPNGDTASFSKNGRFLFKEVKKDVDIKTVSR